MEQKLPDVTAKGERTRVVAKSGSPLQTGRQPTVIVTARKPRPK